MSEQIVLSVDNLSFSYRHNWTLQSKPTIKNITLDVKAGESFGFLGHNGGGKTTTIKCILGLLNPNSGSIKIFNKINSDISTRRFIGYLPEQPYFYDYLTVTEIMEMYGSLSGIPKEELSTAISTALDAVKVSAKSKSPMRTLSKGLTQRVGLAQAIVAKPKLLILDEPFSGLDPIGRKEFRDLFIELRKSGTAIFMCSHVLSDVEFLCDRVSIMAQGEIKGIFDIRDKSSLGTGQYEMILRGFEKYESEIKATSWKSVRSDDARSSRLSLSFQDRASAEKTLGKALALGIEIESYEFVKGTLEDLFVKLVKFEEAGLDKK